MSRLLPHQIPEAVIASRSLGLGKIEFVIETQSQTNSAALVDPDVVIVSVNDGSGWREPNRQLPAGWSLDTYRRKTHKPCTRAAGAETLPNGRRRVYVHLAPPETPEQYASRKRQWGKR